jgi:predicted Ser/Thr protein kinase
MADIEPQSPSSPPVALWQRIADLRRDQHSRWQRGDRRPVEDYFRQDPELEGNEEAVLDCVFGEFVLRQELGETPGPEEYYRRFPRHADRLRRLFAVDGALAASEASTAWPPLADTADVPPPAVVTGPPAAIGKYRVISTLDTGGMGVIYRAVHPTLGKDVVIKMARHALEVPEERAALLAEGRVLAELDHPHLARVYDLDFQDQRPFLVMEYIRGRTLDQHARQTPLTPKAAARLLARVARALGVAHRRSVTHRDIKPKNILIDETGQPRVIDFGLAQTRDAWTDQRDDEGAIVGTIQFMAPEQVRGDSERIGPRTDVYALGAVFYCLLTDHPPVEGTSYFEALQRIAAGQIDTEALVKRRVPGPLRAVCLRALAQDPAARYADADALADALEAALRRRPTVTIGIAAAAVLVLAVLGLAWWATQPPVIELPPKEPPTPSQAKPAPFVYDDKLPTLTVRVADAGGFGKLMSKLPLRTGQELQIEVKAPAALHVTLFLFDSEGKLTEVARRGPDAAPLRYPGVGQTVTLTGPAGTEVLLAVGSRSSPVTLADVKAAWGELMPWPRLPKHSVWRLLRSEVGDEQGLRSFGDVKKRNDPEGEVAVRLEALRGRLGGRFDYFEALAFAHGE